MGVQSEPACRVQHSLTARRVPSNLLAHALALSATRKIGHTEYLFGFGTRRVPYRTSPLLPSRVKLGCLRRIWFGLGFLRFVCCIKPIPTHEKLFAVGKRRPKCHFQHLIFLGLGWPWVEELVGFIIRAKRVSNCYMQEKKN